MPIWIGVMGLTHVKRYMDSEIRAIMAQYMPLDNQGENPNHMRHSVISSWFLPPSGGRKSMVQKKSKGGILGGYAFVSYAGECGVQGPYCSLSCTEACFRLPCVHLEEKGVELLLVMLLK